MALIGPRTHHKPGVWCIDALMGWLVPWGLQIGHGTVRWVAPGGFSSTRCLGTVTGSSARELRRL